MEIIAICETPAEIAGAVDLQKRRLGIVNLALDNLAGVADGYSGKVFCGAKRMGTDSMPLFLGAVGMRLIAVADDEWLPPATRRLVGSRVKMIWGRRPMLLPPASRVFASDPGELPLMLEYHPSHAEVA